MIRAAIVASILAGTGGVVLAQSPSPTFAMAKPLVESWRKCAMDKAGAFLRSGEPAETIAKVALYECRDQRQIVAEALYRSDPGQSTSAVLQIESEIRDFLVSLVVQAKAK